MRVEFLDGGQYRNVKLLDDVCFRDSKGRIWRAPVGLVCDGASIPRPLWPIVGGPYEGAHRDGAVMHDAAYAANGKMTCFYWNHPCEFTFTYTRADADAMLLEAMKVCKVGPVRRSLIYAGVRAGGWHAWANDGKETYGSR